MIYLILAIVMSSMFSVLFKICQRLGIDSKQVILFNYVTALIVSLIPILMKIAGGVAPADYLLGTKTIIFASILGLMFTLGFVTMDKSTALSGVALTTTAARASLVLPVILSWLLLGQGAPKWLGVILILAAMVLIVLPSGKVSEYSGKRKNAGGAMALWLIVVFLVYGFSDFTIKLAQKSVEDVHSVTPDVMDRQLTMLTCSIFIMASVFSLIYCLVSGSFKKHPVTWKSLAGGAALGLVNCGCTWGMLQALGHMNTGTFYPLYNIGIVILATLIGVIAFKEKLKWLQIVGLLVAIGAIALIF